MQVSQVLQPLGAHSFTFFPILPSLNAFLRWRLASWLWGSLFRRVLQPLGAHSLTFFPILPYLNAFLRWRLASWLWGSLFRRVLQPLGAHSLTFFPILPYLLNAFLHSLGDVWHPGSGVPCFGGFCSLWGLTVSLSFLVFPILMHSLGDVWHPGSGVPCFGGFCSLWGLTVSLSSLFFPILMHSLGDVWHPGSGVPWGSQSHFLPYSSLSLSWVPCFGGFCSLWGLTVSLSSLFFPILMHSLGDVWHPGSGVPCFGGFCSLWGLTVSLSSLFFPILMHSLGDVCHPGSGGPCFGGCAGFAGLQPLGVHSLTFFPILPYLNAFLRWRLALGFPVSEGFAAFGGSQSHFLPYSSLS